MIYLYYNICSFYYLFINIPVFTNTIYHLSSKYSSIVYSLFVVALIEQAAIGSTPNTLLLSYIKYAAINKVTKTKQEC